MKLLFVVNMRSGSQRKRDLRQMIASHCHGTPYDIHSCQSKEELDDLVVHATGEGCQALIAVGGDGTVHELAKRLIGSDIALGIIPTGSGNGFARHHGIPCDPIKAMHSLRGARTVEVDTASVNGNPFVSVLGLGYDAEIAHRFAVLPARGLQSYMRAGALALLSHQPRDYELVVDGKSRRESALVVVVANSGQYGNNARIAPEASTVDGLLDLVVIRSPALTELPLLLGRLFAGSIHRSGSVTTTRCTEVTIRRDGGDAHLDGEPVMLPHELQVAVRPRSLRLLVGNSFRQT